MSKSPHPILAVHTTAASAGDGTAAPIWVQLIPAGEFSGRDGRGPFRAGDPAAVVSATRQRAGATEIVIDYDHQTLFSAVPGVGGRAPAAGWVRELQVRPDGIWGRVEWTEAAATAIRAGEYRYLSPAFQASADGAIKAIVSAGLTNVPNLDLAAVTARTALPDGGTMKSVSQALGLPEDAAEALVLAAVQALQSGQSAIATAAGVSANSASPAIVSAVQAMRSATPDPAKYVPVDQVTALQNQLTALSAQVSADAAERAVQAAIAAGKISPALRGWAISYHKADTAGFAAFVAAAPVIVAPGGQSSATAALPPGTAALSAEDHAVIAAMGLDPAKYLAESQKKGG